jgi:hypothetical protein
VANLFFGNVAGMEVLLPDVGLAVVRLPEARTNFTAQALSVAAGGGALWARGRHLVDRVRTTPATNPMLVDLARAACRPPAERDEASRAVPAACGVGMSVSVAAPTSRCSSVQPTRP